MLWTAPFSLESCSIVIGKKKRKFYSIFFFIAVFLFDFINQSLTPVDVMKMSRFIHESRQRLGKKLNTTPINFYIDLLVLLSLSISVYSCLC